MKPKTTFASVAAVSLVLSGCSSSAEDSDGTGAWAPSSTVEFVVGAQPGGGSDVMVRTFTASAEELRDDLSFQVSNYDGVEAFSRVLQMSGDGEALLAATYGNTMLNPIAQDLDYIWSDYTPIALFGRDLGYVVVPADSPYETFEDLVSAAADESLSVGQVVAFGINTIHTQILEEEFDVSFNSVVFDGGGEQVAALLAGDIDFAMMEPAEMLPQVESGDFRPILTLSHEPHPDEALSDIPTVTDAGINASVPVPNQYRAFFGPPDMPEEAQTYWEDVVTEWTETESYSSYVADNLVVPELLVGEELIDDQKQLESIARENFGE